MLPFLKPAGNASVLRNISWLGAASLLVKPLWLLFIVAACPRVLGSSDYGVLSASLALAAICMAFAGLGLEEHTLREVAPNPERSSEFFSTFFALRGFVVLGCWLVILLVAFLLNYRDGAFITAALAGIYFASLNLASYSRTFFRARENLRPEAVLVIIERLSVVILGGVGLWIFGTPEATVAGMAMGTALTALATIAWTARWYAPLRRDMMRPGLVRVSLHHMAPLAMKSMLIAFYMRIDQVMIEAMLTDFEAGQYGQAYRLLESLSLVPAIIVQAALFPRLCRLAGAGELTSFRRAVRTTHLGLFLFSTAVSILLAFIGPWLTMTLAGSDEFADAGSALRLLAWTYPLLCAKDILLAALTALRQVPRLVWGLLSVSVVNVAVNSYAIPTLGIHGAVGATILCEGILVAFYMFLYAKSINKIDT
ncbi:MAG: oligosaccharide flippase family protein [Bacteroidota bacterium]